MSKLCFDINTSINTEDGLSLKEIGAILQNFTLKFLYIKNGKLYGVNKVTDVKPSHRLVCYDGGFQLMCSDMRTTLYCFRKELADHLNKPTRFQNYTFGVDHITRNLVDPSVLPVSQPIHKPAKPDKVLNLNKILGDLERPDPRSVYECHLKAMISDSEVLERLGVHPPTIPPEPEPIDLNLTDPSMIDLAKRFGQSGTSGKEMITKVDTGAKSTNYDTVETDEMADRFGANLAETILPIRTSNDTSRPKIPLSNNNDDSDSDSDFTSDIGAQSRKNGTMALIAALRQKRNKRTARFPINPFPTDDSEPSPNQVTTQVKTVPIQLPCIPGKRSDDKGKEEESDDKGKEEESSWTDENSDENHENSDENHENSEDKVCSVIANILRSKASKCNRIILPSLSNPEEVCKSHYRPFEVSRDEEDEDDISCGGSGGDISDEEFTLPKLPIVPRRFVDNVHLSSLSIPLKQAVIKTVIEMKENVLPVGSIYFNGATFAVLVDEDNIVSVYDWDNMINTERLIPTRFNGEYDGTPGSLPIAQFTVHQYPYRMYLESTGVSEELSDSTRAPSESLHPTDIPCGRIDDSVMAALGDLYGTDDDSLCSIVPQMFEGKKCMVVAKSEVVRDVNDRVTLVLTVLRSRDCDQEPESFWVNHIVKDFTIVYRRTEPDSPDTPSVEEQKELSDDSMDRYSSEGEIESGESGEDSDWSSDDTKDKDKDNGDDTKDKDSDDTDKNNTDTKNNEKDTDKNKPLEGSDEQKYILYDY